VRSGGEKGMTRDDIKRLLAIAINKSDAQVWILSQEELEQFVLLVSEYWKEEVNRHKSTASYYRSKYEDMKYECLNLRERLENRE
jgi:hypothetical protein